MRVERRLTRLASKWAMIAATVAVTVTCAQSWGQAPPPTGGPGVPPPPTGPAVSPGSTAAPAAPKPAPSTAPAIPSILPSVISSATPEAARPQIIDFIKAQLNRIATGAPYDANKALADVIQPTTANARPSPAFLEIYARALAENISIISASKDIAKRLDAAIIVSKVSATSQNAILLPAVEKSIADTNESVSLWGLRGAAGLMPALLANPASPEVARVAAATLKAQATFPSAAITTEAYRVLQAEDRGITALTPQTTKVLQPHVIAILNRRLAGYPTAKAAEPGAEIGAVLFLGDQKSFSTLEPEARLAAVSRLVATMVQAADGYAAAAAKSEEADALRDVSQQAARALQVLIEAMGKDGSIPSTAAQPTLAAIRAAGKLPLNASPDDVKTRTDAALKAVAALPGFTAVTGQ